MKSLYKDALPQLDREMKKTAGFASRLSEQPEMWPQELTSDLHRQLPFLSDYEVNVNLDKVDAERGYAFGNADVTNKTERPEQEHDEAGIPHIRIPLVIKERAVKPFSIFTDGERVLPLNEERIREKLFNPSTFDLSVTPPQDPSLVEPLMPPQRSGIGMGGDYKMASVDEKLLALLQGGKEKKACSPEGTLSSLDEDSWLKRFKGTQFEGRAKELRSAELRVDLAKNRKQQVEAAKPKEPIPTPEPDPYSDVSEKIRLKKRELEMEQQLSQLTPKMKEAFDKQAFKHISKEQWDAMYNSLEIQKLMHDYGGQRAHPAVQNKVYEMATKLYGYHPKPEPPPPQKLQEYHAKQQEKQQKANEKQMQKGQKMLQDGQKAVQSAGGMQKKSSLLLAIAPTVRQADRAAFVAKIASDHSLIAGFRRAGVGPLLNAFATAKLASAEERLAAVADSILPSVVTIQKLPGGNFLVKQANNGAFVPGQEAQGQVVGPEAGAEMMGADQAQAMQPGQSVTAVSDPVDPATQPPQNVPVPVVAEEFGEYLVNDLMGNQIMGWVFPTTMAWDGSFQEQPVALFTNGSSFAVQDTIAGELIGKNSQLPISPIRGEGCFYEVTRDGVRVTAPVTVRGGMTGPDGGQMYQAQDFMGNQFAIHLSPELIQPQQVSDSEFAVPASWKFMALNNQTQLVPDAAQVGADAEAKTASQRVTLFWNGSFHLTGGCGLDKLASEYTQDLDPISAEFMLGLLGVGGSYIKMKLASARRDGEHVMEGLKPITLFAEHHAEAVKTASVLVAQIPDLRRDLVKEAATLEDESTVDRVLALNFVNPENLSTFIDYAPELEETSEKLAEMLLSSYLGMDEIPEGSVERAMKNMEEVLLQLKAVKHAEE
jgi:hypothetical protein